MYQSRNLELGTNILELSMGKKAKKDGGNTSDEMYWSNDMDDSLIDALLHQIDIGSRVNGTFTPRAYDIIVKELSEKFAKDINKDKVKNQLKTIKKNFSECYDIFKEGLSGFGWSQYTGLWTAEPEVWEALIQARPGTEKWMTIRVPNYFKMTQIWRKDRATGYHAETAKEARERNNSSTTIHDIDMMVSQNEATLDDFQVHDVDDIAKEAGSTPSRARSQEPSSKGKKRPFDGKDDIVANALQGVTEVIREGNAILAASLQRVISVESIFTALKDMGFERPMLTKAYNFLVEHPIKTSAFMGCPEEMRKDVLLDLMSSSMD